jgi:hypothetical protein
MDETAGRLRAAIEALGPRRGNRRVPQPLVREALSYAARQRGAGRRTGEIAASLGLSLQTLRRWQVRAKQREESVSPVRRLRPVAIVEKRDAVARVSAGSRFESAPLVLTTAGGHRVEGLSLEQMRLLLLVLPR